MFRRLSSSLPKDPEFPADLEKLGYYINEKDQVRSIARPDEEFNFFISKNERVREMQREAFNTCIRSEIRARFEASGLNITRLPLDAGPTDPHTPILTSSNLATAKRVIVYFGEPVQDLGVFAHRIIGQESIASGSALDLVSAIQSGKDSADTAIVIANLGELVWYRRGQRAMTLTSWSALPRKTGVSNPMKLDDVKNRIPGNRSTKEHVKSVFEEVLGNLARQDVGINVIGLGDGAEQAVGYLDQNWNRWERKVKAICVGLGFVWRVGDDARNEKFMHFSSIMNRLKRLFLVASSLVVIASPRANLLTPSASYQGPTRVCLRFSSLSTIYLDSLKLSWTYQPKRMRCRERSNGRKGSVLKARLLLREC